MLAEHKGPHCRWTWPPLAQLFWPPMSTPVARINPVAEHGEHVCPIVQPPALDAIEDALSLNDFVLGESIGIGAFASVHRAKRKQDGQAVVLKRWHAPIVRSATDRAPADQADGEARVCFMHELDIFRRADLAHPNLIRGAGYGFCTAPRSEAGRAGFLAIEEAAGVDLRLELLRSRVPLATLLQWMLGLARALEHLHAQHIVHRDVKPSSGWFTGRSGWLVHSARRGSPEPASGSRRR